MNAKITPEDMADLPAELVKQLLQKRGRKLGYVTSTTKKLIALIEASAEPLNTDQLLIGMYRTHGEILKRANVQSLMGHAAKHRHITKISGGLYGPATRENPA